MKPRRTDVSSLGAAAEALDAELSRYEALAAGMQRERLDSERNLRRATQTLQALQESEGRLGAHVQGLMAAIGAARDRQQAQAEAVRVRAEELGRRSERLAELLGRLQALGGGAREANGLVQTLAAKDQGSGRDAAFVEVDDLLGRLAADAEELATTATAGEFGELGRQADGLRLQLLTARNRLRLLRPAGSGAS